MNELNEIERLQELVLKLMWNEQLGCYTRQAFEEVIWNEIKDKALYIIFFDVDDMKGLNSRGSWLQTSAIIRESIQMRFSDHKAGQVLSGDEFVVVMTDNPSRSTCDPRGLCERIQFEFKARGASATYAYMRIISPDLQTNLTPVQNCVLENKTRNNKGTITEVV